MHDDGYTVLTLDRVAAAQSVTIQPDETEPLSVTVNAPHVTPVTRDGSDVWVDVTPDIMGIPNPEGTTDIVVEPTPRLWAVLDVLENLGFSLELSECLGDTDSRYPTDRPYVQRFEFDPVRLEQPPRNVTPSIARYVCRSVSLLRRLMGKEHRKR